MTPDRALDRHALVMTVWLAAGVVAVTLFHYGLGNGGAGMILAAFAVILAGFVGHIIVNTVYHSFFTSREVSLGLVIYLVALIAFGFAALTDSAFTKRAIAATGIGFIVTFACVVFAMLTRSGARGAFESFDVIRSFRAGSRRVEAKEGRAE